ncbi:hypothetical protein CKO50_20360 [Pseudoalteromonas sp. HM-SA03]|nr:hypothetical protein CKO50_20360 [Pseudoalteromonas sp. HM-SA03]
MKNQEKRSTNSVYRQLIEEELKIINERIPKLERTIIMLQDILKRFNENKRQFEKILKVKVKNNE